MVENRKRLKHKRRLARPRSGLKVDDLDLSDSAYWSFPLPPISPAAPNQSITQVVVEAVVKDDPFTTAAFARNS